MIDLVQKTQLSPWGATNRAQLIDALLLQDNVYSKYSTYQLPATTITITFVSLTTPTVVTNIINNLWNSRSVRLGVPSWLTSISSSSVGAALG